MARRKGSKNKITKEQKTQVKKQLGEIKANEKAALNKEVKPKGAEKIPSKPKRKAKITKIGGSTLNNSKAPNFRHRVLVATPTMGVIRMEWALSRWGQIIPMNWTMVQYMEYINSYVPMNYTVPDAQNLIVKEALEKDFEWLLLIEDDTAPPPDALVRLNKYMRDRTVPVISGLYFSRSEPSEPLVFRGRGTSVHWDWKAGDLVWCDGVPTGFLLIHCSILRAMWNESPEYISRGQVVRRVFEVPEEVKMNPELTMIETLTGTSDLRWCSRVMKEGFFEKAGWPKYQKMEYPFLVDTNILCMHIDKDGTVYPPHIRDSI